MPAIITIPIKNPQTSFEKAKAKINNAGGSLHGNSNGGNFSGSGVEGSYVCNNGNLTITIEKKPFFIPESLIREKVTGFFAS
ncbi:MAG: hypothetical protein LBI42_15855 [Chitinispirillales bacterium]|jgi:hypothetical protein|nr:hypothetical protein [Chitinispirillales bacterium]